MVAKVSFSFTKRRLHSNYVLHIRASISTSNELAVEAVVPELEESHSIILIYILICIKKKVKQICYSPCRF